MSRLSRKQNHIVRVIAASAVLTVVIASLCACFSIIGARVLNAAGTGEASQRTGKEREAEETVAARKGSNSEKTTAKGSSVNDQIKKLETKAVEEDRQGWPELKDLYDRFQKEGKSSPKQTVSRLVVYLKEQYVAAFLDQDGKSELVRVFPCSSGHVSGHTPIGTFALGMKTVESWLFDGALAQYGGQISGNILFHSLPSYDGSLKQGLKLSDLNAMGQPASHGCVRLFCMDAKWLYENCPSGTTVEVVAERREQEMTMPAAVHYLRLKEGAPTWDPSDPDPDNPYHDFSVLQKWAVEKPWANPFTVVPPIWPQFVQSTSANAEIIPEPAETVENKAEISETVPVTLTTSAEPIVRPLMEQVATEAPSEVRIIEEPVIKGKQNP